MEKEKNRRMLVNIRYAALQGAYWSTYSVMIGYSTAYLVAERFGDSRIGAVLAAASVLSIVAQMTAARFSDSRKYGAADIAVSFLTIAAIASLAITFAPHRAASTAILMLAGTAFLMAIQPLLNSICFLNPERTGAINFGIARGFGSFAYAVTSAVAGTLIQRLGLPLYPILSAAAIFLTIALALSFMTGKTIDTPGEQKSGTLDGGYRAFIKSNHTFVFFCFAVFLVFFDHVLIGNFLVKIVRNAGGNLAETGYCLSLSAIVELPVMALFWIKRNSIRPSTALKASGLMFVVKHAITLSAHSMPALYVAQTFQIGAFGLFFPAATHYISETLPADSQVKGQAFMLGSITLSGVFASVLGGLAFGRLGIQTTLAIGLAVTAAGSAALFVALRRARASHRTRLPMSR